MHDFNHGQKKLLFDGERNPCGRIKGKVHAYSEAVNSGVLISLEQKAYLFAKGEWLSELPPKEALTVSFVIEAGRAKSVMIVEYEQDIAMK
jgi:hypothetical protein